MLLGDELDELETNLTTLVPEEVQQPNNSLITRCTTVLLFQTNNLYLHQCVSILIGKAGSNINTLKVSRYTIDHLSHKCTRWPVVSSSHPRLFPSNILNHIKV